MGGGLGGGRERGGGLEEGMEGGEGRRRVTTYSQIEH